MIADEPPPGPVAPLYFGQTVAEGSRLLARNLPTLAKVSAVPFVLTLLLGHLTASLDPLASRLVWDFAIQLHWTLMAVAWVRHLLLGPAAGEARFFPRLQPQHQRFLGYALLLTCLFLPATLFSLIADVLALSEAERQVAYWALYAALLYLSLRFAFIYVAVPLEETYSLALAWRHTRGVSLALFLAVGLTVLLPWILFSYFLGLVAETDTLLTLVVSILWHVGLWIVEGAFLAFIVAAFRTTTGWVPRPDKAILERFE